MTRLSVVLAAGIVCLGCAAGAQGAELSVRPSQDTAVDATAPRRPHGAATRLRVSGRPLRRAFMRFDLRNHVSTPTKATLHLYLSSRSGGRVAVRPVVAGQRWSERRTTFKNAPVVRAGAIRSRRITRVGWVIVDVTKLIAPGRFSDLAVTGAPQAVMASRESSHPPRLVITPRARPIASPFTPPGLPGSVLPPFVGVAPTVVLTGVDRANEGTTQDFEYAVTDPDSTPAVSESCGAGAERTRMAAAGRFQCRFPDGPARSTVAVSASDGTSVGSGAILVTINNIAPRLTAAAAQSAHEGARVDVNLGSFSDPGADTWIAEVDWGDAATASFVPAAAGALPVSSHSYTDSGTYTVTVKVTDKDGGSDTATFSVAVANVAPTATLVNDGPIAEGTAATISFSGAADPSAPDTAAGFRYAFHCDGSPFDRTPSYDDASTSASTSCQFGSRGLMRVRARIIDKDGGFREYTTDVTVANAAPALTAAPDQRADEGRATAFALGSFADAGGDAGPWTVDVDWGDGTPQDGFSVSSGTLPARPHTYADGPAGRTITVTVSDRDGAQDSAAFNVSVDNVAPTVALDPANPLTADEGQTKTYTYAISDPGDDSVGAIATACGAGGEKLPGETRDQHGGSFGCHFPDGPADTVVSASATDSDGANGADNQTVHVADVAPTVRLEGPQTADEGQRFTYTYTITDPGDDPDPTTTESCGLNAVKTDTPVANSFDCFFPDGPADSTVSVSAGDGDPGGGAQTAQLPAAVRNVAPAVEPAGDQTAQTGKITSIDLGSFTDPNASDRPWTVVVDWGDGSEKATFEAVGTGPLGTRDHTYRVDGAHPIRVSVTDKDGGTGTGPVFTVQATTPVAALTVVLDATPNSPQDFGFTIAGDPGEPADDFVLDDDDDPQYASQRTFDINGTGFGRTMVTGPDVPGWTLSGPDLGCDGGDGASIVDPATRSVELNIGPGEQITCHFDYLQNASVTVVEDADPDSSQAFGFATAGSGAFTLRDDGTSSSRRSFNVSAGGFGPKTLEQTAVAFWALDGIACTGDPDWVPATADGRVDLVVDPGEVIICTYANRRVASVVGGVFPESSSDTGPIADSNGNLYTVSELEAHDPRPCLRKSTDGGRTWTEVDAANRPSYDDLESVSLVKDRLNPWRVHMLMQRSGTKRVSYNSFNMSDAPSAPDTWQTKNEIVAIPAADSTPIDEFVSLVQRSDGDLIAFYATSKSAPGTAGLEQVGFKVKSGGGWGPEQLLVPSASASYTQAVAVMGDRDVAHVFYKNQTTSRIWYRTLEANGTLGMPQELTDFGTNSARHIIATPVAHLHVGRPSDGHVVERFVVGWKRSTNDTLNGAVIDDGVVGPETVISDLPVLSNPASTQSVQTVAGFVADDGADSVYAVYADNAAHDLYYDVLPAGGSWGRDVKMLSGYEVMEIEPIVFTHRPAEGGAKVLGVLFDDNIGFETLGLDNVPRYTELPIG